MVFLFVLFGIIVSYASYIAGTVIETTRIYTSFKTGYSSRIEHVVSSEPDFFYRAFITEPVLGVEIHKLLRDIFPLDSEGRLRATLFTRSKDGLTWSDLISFPDAPPGVRHTPPVPDLEKASGKSHLFKPEVYLGGSNSKAFFLNLTRESDTRYYILEVDLNNEGLKDVIIDRRDTLISTSSVIILFSLILGSLFAKSITRPIHSLSEKALAFADGDISMRFKTHRLDDIGVLSRSVDKMSSNVKHRLKSMQTMNSIDRAVLSSVSRIDLIKMVADLISQQYGNTPACLLESKEEGLVMSAVIPENPVFIGRLLILSEIPWEIINLEEPMVITREEMKKYKGQFNAAFPEELRKEYILVIPIRQNEKLMALFCITLDEVEEQDLETLKMLADQLGVALRSKIEMDQREELYTGTLIALTRSVDAKSKWTAGHSERVARIALAVADRLGMNEEEKSSIKIAALLHDIGKLGIPESILDKPGRLSEEEYDLIKTHPEKGDMIIRDIPGMTD
ncbi:MAG: HD domain-containing protein, partial [Spirochaetales bacterium]|nr:HD domain-containing protein [Spirochaetales bacterium]